MSEQRHICTKDDPWTPEKGRSYHPDAVEIDEHYGGIGDNYVTCKCPHCGKVFEEELPD